MTTSKSCKCGVSLAGEHHAKRWCNTCKPPSILRPDALVCPVCRAAMNAITTQHIKSHGFTGAKEFKEKFNLSHLRADSIRSEHSERMSGSGNPLFAVGHTPSAKDKIRQNRRGKGVGVSGKYFRSKDIREKISLGLVRYYEARPDKLLAIKKRLAHKGFRVKRISLYSEKNESHLVVKSSYEARMVRALDLHPLVESFEYEPIFIPYRDEAGVLRKYFPDFLVRLSGGITEIWEIKPLAFVEESRNKLKMEALNQFCVKSNYNAALVTEELLSKIEAQVGLRRWRDGTLWPKPKGPEDPDFSVTDWHDRNRKLPK